MSHRRNLKLLPFPADSIELRKAEEWTRRDKYDKDDKGAKAGFPLLTEETCSFGSWRYIAAVQLNYLISAFAPASSSFFLPASASAFEIASLTVLGAPSTRSLASFRPRPVISRTALITPTLFAPKSARIRLNSVCSSATAAAAPPAAGADIAAADTPNFSSKALTSSFRSITDISLTAARMSSLLIAI